MIRLGLVGCGKWGWRYVPAALEAGNCVVMAYSRASHAPPEAEKHLSGLKYFDDWRAMLDEPLDAFIVATHPRAHESICVELLMKGKPVMVEKPMTLDLGQALRIAQASARTGAPLLVNHQHLFAPAYEELRARALDWTQFAVVGLAGGPGPVRDYTALWDYGPHDVSMYLGMTPGGCVPGIRAKLTGSNMYRLDLEAGQTSALVLVSNARSTKCRTFIAAAESSVLVYDDLAPDGIKLWQDKLPVRVSDEKPLTRAVRAFAQAVKTGASCWRFDPLLGVEVTRVLCQAEAVIHEKRGQEHGDHN